jgi:integrase
MNLGEPNFTAVLLHRAMARLKGGFVMSYQNAEERQDLLWYLRAHYAPKRLNLSPDAEEQLAVAVRRLSAYAGHPVVPRELSKDLLIRWLKSLADAGQAAATINGKRAAILSLWEAAHEDGTAPPMPKRKEIPIKRKPRRLPNSWTVPQMQAIINSCRSVDGIFRFSGILRADFLESLVLFEYETGSRLAAALRVQPQDLNFVTKTVYLRWESAKTGIEQVHWLSDGTLEAIKKIWDPNRSYIWPWGSNRNCLWDALKRVLRHAGLRSDRRSMFHRFRRTTATLLTGKLGLSAASAALGHTSEETTRRSYVDPTNLPGARLVDHLPPLRSSSG